MAHEAEIIIPGSFVRLQGSPGDGLRNFMTRRLPKLSTRSTSEDNEARTNDDRHHENMESFENETEQPVSAKQNQRRKSPISTPILGQLATRAQMNTTALGGLTATAPSTVPITSSSSSISSSHPSQHQGGSSDQSFIVITNEQGDALPIATIRQSNIDKRVIEEWKVKCRNQERDQRLDWRDTVRQTSSTLTGHALMDKYEEHEMWWQKEGLVAVFSDIPKKDENGQVLTDIIGTIAPGATVVATDIVYLDSIEFERLIVPPTSLSGNNNVYPKPRSCWIQLIQIYYQGVIGYTCLSLDGYWLLAPGLPGLYVDPHTWLWRVVCPAGAFVREGLELNTRHIDTLPYGSLVRVTRRTVNSQGLMRLQVQSKIDDKERSTQRWIDGWCSEYLNPQSGQRGIVVQPLPFPVPALYRVTLPIGAVIRSDIELSSPQIGVVPMGEVLSVVGRAFSEHPVDKCIERLQLAGNGGWISVRLNRPPPNDDLVVELIGVDGNFDPYHPGNYHLEAQRIVRQNRNEFNDDDRDNSGSGDLSSIDSVSSQTSAKIAQSRNQRHGPDSASSSKCIICLTEDRNATIVHGETGHVACCLVCARVLKARGDKCPVCRLHIDLVIQHFWA
jgi:E3 ubiquitin-protein ligase Mdm2